MVTNSISITQTYNANPNDELTVVVRYDYEGILLGIESVKYRGFTYTGEFIRQSDVIRPLLYKCLPVQMRYLATPALNTYSVGMGCYVTFQGSYDPAKHSFALPANVVRVSTVGSTTFVTAQTPSGDMWEVHTSPSSKRLKFVVNRAYYVSLTPLYATPKIDNQAQRNVMVGLIDYLTAGKKNPDDAALARRILHDLIEEIEAKQ